MIYVYDMPYSVLSGNALNTPSVVIVLFPTELGSSFAFFDREIFVPFFERLLLRRQSISFVISYTFLSFFMCSSPFGERCGVNRAVRVFRSHMNAGSLFIGDTA